VWRAALGFDDDPSASDMEVDSCWGYDDGRVEGLGGPGEEQVRLVFYVDQFSATDRLCNLLKLGVPGEREVGVKERPAGASPGRPVVPVDDDGGGGGGDAGGGGDDAVGGGDDYGYDLDVIVGANCVSEEEEEEEEMVMEFYYDIFA